MAKVVSLLMIGLLLCSTLTYASRPEPGFADATPANTLHADESTDVHDAVDVGCEGIGETECLTRRTLAAHIDYIYTQKENP
ncbi:phytosulfokines-like [Juglans regia]|uniref:Phytosulfokine n=1 Tax=Juglans regia TaxID=51240 RepID=A0A2I4HMI7_JUGRE|nr:phytosulfokines-like [Juglans regia]